MGETRISPETRLAIQYALEWLLKRLGKIAYVVSFENVNVGGQISKAEVSVTLQDSQGRIYTFVVILRKRKTWRIIRLLKKTTQGGLITMLDYTKIQYEEGDEERFGVQNAAFCEAVNEGAEFQIVFKQGMPDKLEEGDLYYALVLIQDGRIMPYPIFAKALGEDLEQGREEVPSSEFLTFWGQHFGSQFVGVIEDVDSEELTEIRMLRMAATGTPVIEWVQPVELLASHHGQAYIQVDGLSLTMKELSNPSKDLLLTSSHETKVIESETFELNGQAFPTIRKPRPYKDGETDLYVRLSRHLTLVVSSLVLPCSAGTKNIDTDGEVKDNPYGSTFIVDGATYVVAEHPYQRLREVHPTADLIVLVSLAEGVEVDEVYKNSPIMQRVFASVWEVK